jgi:hypothetical protein
VNTCTRRDSFNHLSCFLHVNGKFVIITVVDRFSKYAHFISIGHPYTATFIACAFFNGTVRLHGILSSIVSDRNPVFTNRFLRKLFSMVGVKLKLSSAFRLQIDGQSEATKKVITMYHRCLISDRPRQWLPWVEFCYNFAFHKSLRTMLFRVVYGRDTPSMRDYSPGEACLPAVHHQLLERFGTSLNRHRTTTSSNTFASIENWSSSRENGCGSASHTTRWCHSRWRGATSWVPNSMALFKFRSMSATSRTRWVPNSMALFKF